MMENLTRRRFMRETAQGAVGLAAMAAAAPSVLSVPSPNELLGVGCIGLGTRGGNLLSGPIGAATGIKVVAVSDVYKPHLEKGVQRSK
ncbi:MAG: twin-arginine translocation signal domain-containing protein, partial [Verrucomicrobiota bacterium]|nr:twin-arginine translocation signal domain-containing protein [Verrucomicrobiota bacterium]